MSRALKFFPIKKRQIEPNATKYHRFICSQVYNLKHDMFDIRTLNTQPQIRYSWASKLFIFKCQEFIYFFNIGMLPERTLSDLQTFKNPLKTATIKRKTATNSTVFFCFFFSNHIKGSKNIGYIQSFCMEVKTSFVHHGKFNSRLHLGTFEQHCIGTTFKNSLAICRTQKTLCLKHTNLRQKASKYNYSTGIVSGNRLCGIGNRKYVTGVMGKEIWENWLEANRA